MSFPKAMDFHKICRTCLGEREQLRVIVDNKISHMLETCFDIQVKKDDKLPQKLCILCFRFITKFYTFKKKVERYNRILKNQLTVRNQEYDLINKFEDASDDDAPLSNLLKDDLRECTKDLDSGPPPLIPLQNKVQVFKHGLHLNTSVLKEAPPLVPIKQKLVPNEIEKLAPANIKLECTLCGDEFNSVVTLKEHRKSQCQSDVLQCNVCKKEFKERKKLIGHLKGHMIRKEYMCKICGKRYPNPSTFKVHMRTHTGERPFKCQICNKGFVRWAGVVGHMKTHTSHKPYKCNTCDKAFKIASNLERHKVLHSGSLPFCCNFCGKTFSQSDNLQLHIRTCHTFEKPFLCNECGKGFASSSSLNRHMWVHSGYKPYSCDKCPKTYSNSNDFKIHLRSHYGGFSDEEKPHVCTICNMRFLHACRLTKHMKIHDKKQCFKCNKFYRNEVALTKHIEQKH
ncbi:PREDICTED: zinc finger protein OZF [Nicrophorus vespilloides]|uniref:Zinc finger protein OZF n=1 Tax=Nicrophorus vespilloides TaxID=110193 RepID=A0ABM1MUB3_NICVS|nr:PREDICTED: zinc finger protein OZF [Nicrophorus vespilloides]